MDRDELARLDAVAGKTRAEVAAQDPALLNRVREAAAARAAGPQPGEAGGAGGALPRPRPDGAGAAGTAGTAPPVRPKVPLITPDDITKALPPDAPLAADPTVRDEMVRARLNRLGTIAGVAPDAVERLAATDASPASVDDAVLTKLVDTGGLSDGQARDLGLTVSLYRLVDEDLALTHRLRDSIEGLPGPRVDSVRDLVRLREGDWRRLLDEVDATLPVGLDRDQHARLLGKRIEALYPTDTLLARIEAQTLPAAMRRFVADNDDVELLNLDYALDSPDVAGLNFGDLSVADRHAVLGTMKGYQRVYALAPDADHAAKLLAAGYSSATAIVADGYETFAAKADLAADTSARYYSEAVRAVGAATAGAWSIVDSIKDGFSTIGVGNLGPDILDYFRRIDGFEDLFGSQDYCDCEHCSSILGPGAYFVDLMHFVETKLVDRVFTGALRGHVLDLRTRRPDLWQLKVTCENVSTEIPQLVIVNEILENYIARRHGYTGSLDNRTAVHEAVYRDRIATAVDSFRQPFLLPLHRLRTYLRHFFDPTRGGRSHGDITRLLGAAPDTVAAAELGLSTREHELITGPNADLAFLRRVYGIAFAPAGDESVPQLDAQQLLRPVGVTREQLGALVATQFVSSRGSEPIRIVGQRSGPGSVQNDVEHLRGLRLSSLDRLHRFTRLWRAVGWTIGELDLTLSHLRRSGLAGTDTATTQLGRVRALCRRFNASVEAVVVLYDILPTTPVAPGEESLFDRAFNLPDFVRIDERLPKDAVRYLHPSLADDPAAPVPHIHRRLLAGLRVSSADLAVLVRGLAAPLGIDPAAATEAGRSFPLTVANLSLLYRHARLAESLRLSAAALLRLIDLAPGVTGTHVANLTEVEALLEFTGWLKESGRTADEIAYVTGAAVDNPALFPDPAAAAARIVERVRADAVPAFTDATAVLRTYLAPELDVDPDKALELVALAGVDPADADLCLALRGDGPIAEVEQAIAAVARPAVLLRGLDADAVAFVAADPARFAIADLTALTVEALMRVHTYRTHAGTERGADVRTVLAAFDPASRFAAADQAALGRIFAAEPTLVASMHAQVTLPGQALPALDTLAECLAVAAGLGIGGEELSLLAATDYDRLSDAADAILAAFRAKYPDETVWREKIRPFDESLLERRRDALVDHLVHSIHPEFTTPEDIYRYFLIDVEVEGCFITSRIVAANSSLQLYVHRVLMNLEQDAAGNVHVRPDYVPRDEWAWRERYRVWEANRKVFLWPENYLMPDLRDDKTPLFEQLESTLLQKDIDEQGVLDAYGAYLEGFREVAGLKIAGAYHDIDKPNQSDVLHLFGVTPGDPLTYYHRTVENAYHAEVLENRGTVWSAWQKMDVKIPVRKVAPVVHDGRLSVFWVEVTTTPQNLVSDGGSRFVGYSHRLALKFTTLRLDGRWTAPQDIRLYGVSPFVESDGVLDDPLAEPNEWNDFWDAVFGGGFGVFANPDVSNLDEATRALITPRYDTQPHSKARDGYTLRGREWEQVFPEPRIGGVFLAGVGFHLRADLDLFAKQAEEVGSIVVQRLAMTFNSSPPSPVLCQNGSTLHYGTPSFAYFDDHAYAALVADRAQIDRVFRDWTPTAKQTLALKDLYEGQVANIGSGTVAPINGALTDGIIDIDGDLYLLQSSVRAGARWLLRRLGTTLAEQVHRTLFTDGVDGMLSLATQRSLREANRRVSPAAGDRVDDKVVAGRLDFTGPYGTYYREIFFHIPFLIAHHLNSQGKYEQAQRWYQYIFDPTAAEVIPDDPTLSAEANLARKKDRNWRYLEFRGLDVPTLRAILTDEQAIEAYKRDPFNPHAIARLRLTAYQKAIVMRYIDNLLDWGDDLFTQFQMETVNEATMLYATAADILGERPAKLGGCGERSRTWTYEELKPALSAGSEFLIEVEHLTWLKQRTYTGKRKILPKYALDGIAATSATSRAVSMPSLRELGVTDDPRPMWTPPSGEVRAVGRARVGTAIAASAATRATTRATTLAPTTRVTTAPVVSAAKDAPTGGRVVHTDWNTAKGDRRVSRLDPGLKQDATVYVDKTTLSGHLGWSVIRQVVPAFCVPHNKDLLAYWDRVADRLAKIRGCRDITGARRSLSLFAPEIDPMLLVRARAAGLSVQDVIDVLTAEVPPYRFTYLIEKAKQFTAAVQGFGASLQAALERKDAEELAQLRNSHQRNLLTLSTMVREWDRDAAAASLEALQRRKTTVEHRRDYYQGLLRTGLVAEEWAQRVFRHVATGAKAVEATFGFLAGALNLLPQIGSPFAMKYGGVEVGNSAHRFAVGTRALADLADTLAASVSLEAGFVRRDEGWRQQATAAVDELNELDRQIVAAQLRYDIAEQSVTIHNETLAQVDEVIAFYADRFTELGLYTYLSTTLQSLHRTAFNAAFSLARMAERALRYERDDIDSAVLGSGHWDAGRAGLLAASKLMTDLLGMEQRYIATNRRTLEVDQSFSLSQIDPAALATLKETAECTFTLPEVMFDLVYPGHYGRRIKAVRLTIPCVTGPYANVAATLTLVGHSLRREPGLSDTGLADQPLGQTTTVATSSAQNDAGVFELNFRDERYLPFEGAGAVSRWQLTLPRSFPQFDYQTINDVIVRLSYTARSDDAFRVSVEEINTGVAGTIAQVLASEGLSRLISLRHDFSTAFNRLLHFAADTAVTFDIGAGHLPFFLNGRSLTVSRALLVLRTAPGQSITDTRLTLTSPGSGGSAEASGFTAQDELGGLPAADVTTAFTAGVIGRFELTVAQAGDLAPDSPTPGDPSAIDETKLADIMVYLEYAVG
ncbi:MAG TPA: neuraminidase-like domain-containing protein [Candidatus Limnocylindrales bacterium]|nr:neuraminidase-like domain-containing protein [Candidatus Limnocylindrales bacterium]